MRHYECDSCKACDFSRRLFTATYDVNVVLIIDEIQELLRSEAGLNQLAALKAARDAVNLRPNNPNDTYFLLVGIGSQHSLIKSMVIGSSQAFYGSDHLVFPLLSDEYLI